jgi:hypothetical protein
LNEFALLTLSAMAKRNPARRKPDMPMVMQPEVHGRTVATQMLPIMPGGSEPIATARKSIAETQPTRTEAVRAAKAKIMRRNSLQKQRAAQKTARAP